jgi:hypothetical protein
MTVLTHRLSAVWERVADDLLVTVELDGELTTVTVAEAADSGGSGCPSEAEYETQLQDAAWEAEVGCLACGFESGDVASPYDDHTCVVYEREVPRPYATQMLAAAGRPAWCRVEFTGWEAGIRPVELLDAGEVNRGWVANPPLDVTPTEWDVAIEWVDSHTDEWVRLRHVAGETRHRLAGYLMQRVAAARS